ncbi:MAG: hypothetical protein LBS29_04955 [Endomicrobium sp.]|jgi:hypothetical protein|nr:hypothetical protein [Endomicrobium sp.]
MIMTEFIQQYCQDIVAVYKKRRELFDDDDFAYDDIIYDEDGIPVKIVYAGKNEIPIQDILGLERLEFQKMYPDLCSLDVYDTYIDSYVFFEGEDALHRVRKLLAQQKEEMDLIMQLPLELR